MRILVECYPDAALLHALGVRGKQLRHERCKGEVVKRVLKFDCAIGLIDEDPSSAQPRDLDNYEELQAAEGLRLLARRDDKTKRLVIVCPRLEDWLFQRARSSDIKPEEYGLPTDPDHLHGIPRYELKGGFQRFLAELKERDSGIHLLRQWLVEQES
ncbi:MAG: hypothetical protein JSW66_09865 [Phycisphaerales bacterium]|nr:MAG: hypothetical protein JSW66_09865 [Phycisphaerales bacterium]